MAKQVLDEGLGLGEPPLTPKSGLANNLVSLFRFILSILILPLIIGFTLSFSQELMLLEDYILNNFIFGLVGYLSLHLFIYQPHSFYNVEQRVVDGLFGFFGPLKELLRYRLPVFSLIVLITYFILKVFFGYGGVLGNFIFLLSFTASMHLILAAVHLKEESTGILKGDYFLSLSTVYLFEIVLIAVFVKLMVSSFSIMSFFREGFSFFINTHIAIWKQIFVIR